MKRNVILFGAGNNGKIIIDKIRRQKDIFLDQYIAFADNASDKIGTIYEGLPVIDAKELRNESADCFIVCPECNRAIIEQLVYSQKISREKVLSFDEYNRQCYSEKQFFYRQNKNEKSRGNTFNTSKIVVYTAITGMYDNLKDPLFIDDNITYVCFTNNKNLVSGVWNVEYITDDSLDNCRLARKIKCFPDSFFQEFDTSVWIDGKYILKDDIRLYVSEYQGNSSLLCFPHFSRECIYDEAIECILTKKASKEDVIDQICSYRMEKYPFNNGLFETGCIVRNHNDTIIKKIMKEWNYQINRYTVRDQISLPYVCWKNSYTPDISDLYIEKNRWLEKKEHNC